MPYARRLTAIEQTDLHAKAKTRCPVWDEFAVFDDNGDYVTTRGGNVRLFDSLEKAQQAA
jgi:hypothetical protein